MKKILTSYFVIFIICLILCTGCNSHKKEEPSPPKTSKITRYKSGTIVIEDHTAGNQDKSVGDFAPEKPFKNMQIGPEEIKFGNEP